MSTSMSSKVQNVAKQLPKEGIKTTINVSTADQLIKKPVKFIKNQYIGIPLGSTLFLES
jgi:hypothetical protein